MVPSAATEDIGYWNSVADEWTGAETDIVWRRHSDAVNLALLGRWLPGEPARRLLKTDLFDEAVSEGLFPGLESYARTAVGVDLSPRAIGRARVRGSFPLSTCTDVRRLPFPDGCFDVVVSNSTLDHFTSFDAVLESLRELHRVLLPGGQLILTMDNLANPLVALRNSLPFTLWKRLGLVPYFVGATCGPRRLRRAVLSAGFQLLETTAIMHCPRVLMVRRARKLQAKGRPEAQTRFLRRLMRYEVLARWPTRFLTGYFVAVRCVK